MTNDGNRKIFALADHAVDEIDLALGNEFELDARNRVEQVLLKTVAQAAREAKIEAYEEAATIADGWDSASNGNHARNVADDVRALKDSLAETVPSR